MASVVEVLDSALQAMQALKPPGVSGSKIASITALCENNVQVRSPRPRMAKMMLTPSISERIRHCPENLYTLQENGRDT